MIDHTHDAAARSWVESANGHPDFPIQNLPLGVFSPPGGGPRCGVAIGDRVLDLAASGVDQADNLNAILGAGPEPMRALRHDLFARLSNPARRDETAPYLHAQADCTLHLPTRIGDYTDFYAGIHHAENIGRQFRPDNPLLPNYKYVPIGYHGRASSVRVSGEPVVRPNGQTKPADAAAPSFGPSRRLDYEMEMAIWIGRGNPLGRPIPIGEAPAHIAGLGILNDWSARDLQAWEYQPLGPFLAKNFHSTVSPWIVTAEALAPFRIPQPPRPEGDPAPLPYLSDPADQANGAFAITMEVALQTAAMRAAGAPPHRLSRGPMSAMYWTAAQLVTHHASNGCNLAAGDLLGTGTISSASREGFGSLMELTVGGARPLQLPGGEQRTYLEDGDELTMTAYAEAPGAVRIGFGECRAQVLAQSDACQ